MIDRLKAKYRLWEDRLAHIEGLSFEARDNTVRLSHRLNSQDLMLQDMLLMQLKQTKLPEAFALKTDHPVAIHSHDHLSPWGAAHDNTRHPRFVSACEQHFGRALCALDLGCSGGGLVWDFLMAGHRAAGLEGSDFSLLNRRAMWRLIPKHLNTCDITKPFTLDAQFDVISAWEVLEHIETSDISQLLSNIHAHLRDDGLFAASVSTLHDINAEGIDYHRTVQPKAWWLETFLKHGLEEVADHSFTHRDYVRGSGNGPMDWDAALNPEAGFHIVLRKATS